MKCHKLPHCGTKSHRGSQSVGKGDFHMQIFKWGPKLHVMLGIFVEVYVLE
jgi:hypothetical protein